MTACGAPILPVQGRPGRPGERLARLIDLAVGDVVGGCVNAAAQRHAARANEPDLPPPDSPGRVGTLVRLITALRQCRSAEDFYDFQQDLLARVLEVQEHRAGCRRVAKLLRQGKAVPADAPELRSTDPATSPETWNLEADVCERVDRQLRSVADGLAWRVFSYDRRVIIALSRNQHPGPMVGKKGLAAERESVTKWWRDEGRFVLLHDLTSCLTIGDATSFNEIGNDYEAYLHEIKSDPNRTVSRQARRQRMAEEAIRSGGPLPGDLPGRLVPLDIPYKTHLDLLGTAFDLAHDRGVQGMKVPGGRALVATDIVRGYDLWSERELIDRRAAEHLQAVKRARILDVGHLVWARSDDLVARSPTMPPWSIYPLSPALCARLITDYAMYFVTMSSEPLLAALDDVGLAGVGTPSRSGNCPAGRGRAPRAPLRVRVS
jgi:hypothetical protein